MLKVYIISLVKDVEKRKVITKSLLDLQIDFEFVDAIYGKELSHDEIKYYRKMSAGKILRRKYDATLGEIGCTLSHLKAYHNVLLSKDEWACILEDDAILDSRFKKFLYELKSDNLNKEHLYLLGGQEGLCLKNAVFSKKNTLELGGEEFKKSLKSERNIFRTCCYLVSDVMAKKIIDLSHNKLFLADDWGFIRESGCFKYLYLSDFVSHPIDLIDSNIEVERQISSFSAFNRGSLVDRIYIRIYSRFQNFLKKIRTRILKIYVYLERKD